MIEEVFICDCGLPEHQLRFMYNPEEKTAYVIYHMTKMTFWRRLKYLFGYQSDYGAFDEILLSQEDMKHMLNCFDRVVNGAPPKKMTVEEFDDTFNALKNIVKH